MNDIENFVTQECQVVQFADDTILFTCNSDPAKSKQDLEINLQRISQYLEMNELTMNAAKTDYLVIGQATNLLHTISVNKMNITNSISAKYLGVIIDTKFKYEEQVNVILRKMAYAIRTIHAIKNQIPLKTRLYLLDSLAISHLRYSAPLLTSITEQSIKRLDRQLNWGLKTCFCRSKFDHVTPLRIASGILDARHHISIAILTKLWPILNKTSAAYKHLVSPTLTHTKNKRTQHIIMRHNCHTSFMSKSFSVSSTKIWNNLTITIRETTSYNNFKYKIKKFLYDQYCSLPHDRIIQNWIQYILQ